ncbi:hypothetical protein SEEA9517_04649, partial [Salmonella enterica subsp. enterica serovar Agona str. 400095 17]
RFQYDSHAFRNTFLCVQPVDNFTGNGGFVSQNLVLFFTAGAGSKQTKIDFILLHQYREYTQNTSFHLSQHAIPALYIRSQRFWLPFGF